MKIGTLKNGTPDGQLIIISKNGQDYSYASDIVPNFHSALENWDIYQSKLIERSNQLNQGEISGHRLDYSKLSAPLPRCYSFLDGSTYPSHLELMERAFNLRPPEGNKPLMYQGLSSKFFAHHDDIPFVSEDDFIDFEAEIGVITDFVPANVSVRAAQKHIKFVVLINDWSLRKIGPREMKNGFGWVNAKPACALGPYAVSIDEIPFAENGQIDGYMNVTLNGKFFGKVTTNGMKHNFAELIAHAAYNRDLPAGTIIGSGTVSSAKYLTEGSCCIGEKRAAEMISVGAPKTAFMKFGENIKLSVEDLQGNDLLGIIFQKVIGY